MKIRSRVFETNSSSTHSLSIDEFSELQEQPFTDEETRQGFVEVRGSDFGWEVQTYRSVHDKLSYLMTSIMSEGENPDTERLGMLCDVVKEYAGLDVKFVVGSDGYIDHQSSEVALKAFKDKETLKRFLFSPRSTVTTDNDNH